MKTPKREYKGSLVCWATGELDEYVTEVQETRWKRKNRTVQLKRTIKRLKEKYIDLLRGTEMTAIQGSLRKTKKEKDEFFKRLIDGAREKLQEESTHKTAENGQQTDLPPAGGQQDRKEQA